MSHEFEQPNRHAEILDDLELTLVQLCQICQLPTERIFALVEEGIVEPLGDEPNQWRFRSVTITRIQRAHRLERDLGVNMAGVALALDLLEEIDQLKRRLQRFQHLE
jgi:chaperone modulatory protein CbpM